MTYQPLKGQKALVTGANSGIGEAWPGRWARPAPPWSSTTSPAPMRPSAW